MTVLDRVVAPGFYRFALGNAEITVLNDGHFTLPGALPDFDVSPHEYLALNIDPETREEYFRSRMIPDDDMPLQANPAVIDIGDRRVLVDTGWDGEGSPPTSGRLGPAMDAAGIPAESVDVVFLTHGHPDHLGGIVDPGTGRPLYPNAELVMGDVELDLWMGDDAEATFRDTPLPLPMIQGVLGAVDDRIRTIRAGEEVVPGVGSISTPGHTTGHMSLVMEAGGRELLLTGDAIATIHVAFERPEWHNLFDMDPALAGQTRRRLLDRAATDELLILGYHLPFPGLGCALRDGSAYRWYPAEWTVLT